MKTVISDQFLPNKNSGYLRARSSRQRYIADSLQQQRIPQLSPMFDKMMKFHDTSGAMFMARQLEYIEARVYERKYAELKARIVMPVDSSGGMGIEQYTYRTMDYAGSTVYIDTMQENDLPIVNTTAKEIINPVKYFGNKYTYTMLDLERAAIAGVPLQAFKAFATRDIIERKIEQLAFFGDAEVGVNGMLTNGDVPRFTYANGASGHPQWNTKTPQEILFDIINAIATMRSDTLDIETPDTLIVPSEQYSLLVQPRSDVSDTNLLNWIINNIPDHFGKVGAMSSFTILPVPLLAGTGLSGLDRSVFLRRNPEKLSLVIPTDVMILEPNRRDLTYDIPMFAGCGGAVIRYPLSLAFWDGL